MTYNSHIGQTQEQVALICVEWTFFLLSTIVVTLRLYTRAFIVKNVQVDDWLILPAIGSLLAFDILDIFGMREGVGIHEPELSFPQVIKQGQLAYYSQILYVVSLFIVKTSILLTYLRIFTIGRIRIVIKSVIFVLAAITLATSIAIIFHCIPIKGNFYQSSFHIPGDRCINIWNMQYILSSLVIVTDLVVLILPVKNIWSLSIVTKQRRVGILCLFSLGGLACIASILRVYILSTLETIDDKSLHTFAYSMCSSLEISLSMIAVSIPATTAFFTKFFPKLKTERGSTSGQSALMTFSTNHESMREIV